MMQLQSTNVILTVSGFVAKIYTSQTSQRGVNIINFHPILENDFHQTELTQ